MGQRSRIPILLGIAGVLLVCALAAGATQEAIYLEGGLWNVTVPPPVPPSGTMWQQIYPDDTNQFEQTKYHDNGDEIVSVCDNIELEGVMHHIDWVGPTYWVSKGPDTMAVEPEPANPDSLDLQTCDILHEIWPEWCNYYHVIVFQDNNGNSYPDACDDIQIDGEWWHIEKVTLNIVASVEVPAVSRVGMSALIAALLLVTAIMLVYHRRKQTRTVV